MRSAMVALSVIALAGCAHHPEPAPTTPVAVARPLAAAAPSANTFRVHVIVVGTGLSVFVRGHDFALLYDAGSNDDLARGAGNRVVAYLRAAEPDLKTIDHVILSHPHRDHVELLADVIAMYEIRNVWDSGVVNPVCGYRRFLDAVAAARTTPRPRAGRAEPSPCRRPRPSGERSPLVRARGPPWTIGGTAESELRLHAPSTSSASSSSAVRRQKAMEGQAAKWPGMMRSTR